MSPMRPAPVPVVAKPRNDPNQAVVELGSSGAISGNIGSLSLPVRALDGNVLWSGRKVSESDSDVQRQSRGRISRAQTDRAATNPVNTEGAYNGISIAVQRMSLPSCSKLFHATRPKGRFSVNAAKYQTVSEQSGTALPIQQGWYACACSDSKELIKRWSRIRVH